MKLHPHISENAASLSQKIVGSQWLLWGAVRRSPCLSTLSYGVGSPAQPEGIGFAADGSAMWLSTPMCGHWPPSRAWHALGQDCTPFPPSQQSS